jgi:hypothetical protein
VSTVDVTVRLQALDGTWETCGSDRAISVLPETLTYSHNEWGPDKASFDLHRSPIAIWPDLGAFSPVEIEVGGVIVWEGRTGETPLKSGSEQVINVQCEGWQYHLDDDVYQRAYVHSKLTDWKDARGSTSTDLTTHTTAYQITTGQGEILIAANVGASIAQFNQGRVVLDLGRAEAARVVLVYAGGGSADYALDCDASATSPSGTDAGAATVHAAALPTGETTFSLTFTNPARYVSFTLYKSTAGSAEATSTAWVKLKSILVFAATAYESGNASILHASTVALDALERATMLLSSDVSQVAATSFVIPDFTLAKASTPREAIEAANAYQNWIAKLLIGRRVSFQERPTDPLLEIGAWSGADIEDASANSGAEIYNRALVEANGPDGSPLVVERTAAQQPGVLFLAPTSPAPENPSFTTNTASWTASGGGTLTRVTAAGEYHTAPGAGKWTPSAHGQTLTEAFSGTFHAGVAYVLTIYIKVSLGRTLMDATLGVAGDQAIQDIAPSTIYEPWTVTWTPLQTHVGGVTFSLTERGVGGEANYVDDLTIQVAEPTLVDRRIFRRTKVIQMSSAITATEGKQLADIFLQAHTTTPFKGSATVTPDGVRKVLGGQSVHPSQIGLHTQELIRLSHLTDPDTGGIGRDGTIHEVQYTHRDQKAQVVLDDSRGNFDSLLARLAVVQTPGS